ncbi:CIA30-domain-containing protein [Testicularia cyperi]|uniref:CIA30-domain-containing protein n=1 Tax=Testicularia cyperi TaxID=1882483 RepID=A0A317XXT5_9BASI|nr:CIA30-domain-containing protein [Testicularia cyperi]
MSYQGTTPLFAPGPNPRPPAFPWRSDQFFAVDDKVRGGSSHSHMRIVQYPPTHRGDIVFSGFLDTTTLGGAGFASQVYSSSLPANLSKDDFSGLRIVVRKQTDQPESDPPSDGPTPGGGRGPVRSFVFQIKTEVPERRPDGRRESVVVWEWCFEIPTPSEGDEVRSIASDKASKSDIYQDFYVFESTWDDFKPFYRGKPVDPEKAGDFQPEKTVEWSFMARSNFQAQSGAFSMQVHSLSAINRAADIGVITEKQALATSFRNMVPAMSTTEVQSNSPFTNADSSSTLRGRRTSSEYYGFALFIFATLLWILWVVWALTPDAILESIGIGWYPNREWAFLIPAWSLVAVLAIYAVFIGINLLKTPELDHISNVTDSAQNVYRISIDDEQHVLASETGEESADPNSPRHVLNRDIYDLPPGYVSRHTHLSES